MSNELVKSKVATIIPNQVTNVYSKFKKLSLWKQIATTVAAIAGGLFARKFADIMRRRYYGYPPGPIGLPFFGNLLSISHKSYYSYLLHTYGSVCMIQLGYRTNCVIINDLTLAKKCMSLATFSLTDQEDIHGKRIATTKKQKQRDTGMNYKQRRQMLQKTFISMLNSNYLSTVGCKHWQIQMYPILDELNGKQILCLEYIQYATFAMIFTSIFGEYVPLPLMNSDEFNNHKTVWDEIVDNFIIRKLYELGLKPFYTMKLPQSADKLWPLLWKWVEKYDENKDNIQLKNKYEQQPLIYELRKKYSKNVTMTELSTIFIASMTTTKVALNCCLILVAKHKKIQKKLYKELIEFTDENNGIYELKQVQKLHYLRAFVHEILRWTTTPINLPKVIQHEKVKLLNYNIPKGAVIIDAYRNFSTDNKYWKDEFKFNPQNHLDENGMFKKQKAFCSFGMGKRDCAGQSLALRALYLLLGKLVQRYELSLSDYALDKLSRLEINEDRQMNDFNDIPIQIKKREN